MVQLIDVSSKILYNEARAEREMVIMINATISHEMRNPLNSMIGQITHMKFFLKKFKKLRVSMREGQIITSIML
jgi:signal transduction histidine kinase